LLLSGKIRAVIRAVNAPIQNLSAPMRIAAGLVAIVGCMLYAMFSVAHLESVYVAGDARFYLGIATGDYSQVMQPFASRQLGALLVTGLMHLLHCSVERGFAYEGTASIVVMLVVVYYLVLKTAAPRWMLFAIAFVPFWSFLLQDLVLPDLWYSALLAVMLLMLDGEHLLAAAIMMFPLMLSRESTSLTLVCFLIAAWTRLSWRDRAVAVISTVVGSVVVKHLAARAQPNSEHLPESIYMLAKVPWNFMNNILGLAPWSNVNTQFAASPGTSACHWSMRLFLYGLEFCVRSSLERIRAFAVTGGLPLVAKSKPGTVERVAEIHNAVRRCVDRPGTGAGDLVHSAYRICVADIFRGSPIPFQPDFAESKKTVSRSCSPGIFWGTSVRILGGISLAVAGAVGAQPDPVDDRIFSTSLLACR
jgi:hypothetical protein